MLKTGKPDTQQDSSSHTPGINQGNSIGNYAKQVGHLTGGKRTAASATGVNPSAHGPIDERMPNLPPA